MTGKCRSCRPVDALDLTLVNGVLVCTRCDGLPLWPNLAPTEEDRQLARMWALMEAVREPGGLQRLADGLRDTTEDDGA